MPLTVGQQVGSYRIVQEIAHGQYANVYKATHSILTNRVVALKILYTTRINSEQEFTQFFQEARILEQLQHPAILPVIDTNVYEHSPYTVTEFAAHGSLRNLLRKQKERPLSLAEALEILQQIGAGLQFAHEHKIVHSDIKPENILFNASDSVRISDFDIARTLHRANSQAASVGGTPLYMAPEQFQGKVRKESDQYALGCIAYELLTGRRAFGGTSLEEITQAHLHGEVQPPSALNKEIAGEIEQAVLRALAVKYTERHESVEAFIQALTSAAQHPQRKGISSGVRQEKPLILKGKQRGRSAGASLHDEKTLVNAGAQGHEDPFSAVTLVDEQAPVKRRTARTVASGTEKSPMRTTHKTAAAGDEREATETKKAVRKKVATTKAPAEKPAAKHLAEKATTTKKSPVAAEERSAPVVHKTAAMLAREALLPHAAPAEAEEKNPAKPHRQSRKKE